MSQPIDFSQYRRKNQDYDGQIEQSSQIPSPQQNNKIDFSQFKRKESHTPVEKTGRLLGQYGIGAVEAATLPYNAAAFASNAYVKSPGVGETLYRQQLFEDIEQMAEQKQTGVWSPEDEAHFQKAQELIKNPEELKKNIPKEMQGLDTGSLLETAFEKAGVDMKPEGIAENAVRWMGFIKDPRKIAELSKMGVDLLKGPEKWQHFAKAILPTGKEAIRGLAAGTALEAAADNELGPIGTMTAAIVGDLVGAGLPGLAKGTAKFVMHPIQTSKEWAARAVVAGTRLSGAEKIKIQQDLIKEFRDAGIQADIGSITGSNLVKVIQSRLVQSGLVGEKLDKFRNTLTKQITDEYGKLAEGLGEARFSTLHEAGSSLQEGIQKGRDVDLFGARRLYKDARELGKGKFATLETPALAKKIEELEQQLAPGSVKSPETQKVINELSKLKSDLFDAQGHLKPASVSDLINNKINLNDIIDYEVQGGAKQLLKSIVKDIDDALKGFGRTQSPEFLKKYEAANNRFASHAKTFRNKNISDILKGQDPQAIFNKMNTVQGIKDIEKALSKTPEGRRLFNDLKRAKFDDLVMKNMVDGATDQLKMGKFSNILEKGKNREIVKELLGESNFPRFERLTRSTGKLAESAQKYFNASKSGTTAIDVAFATKALFDMASMLSGNPWPFLKTAGGFATARSLSILITDPVFLKTIEDGILSSSKNDLKGLKEYFNYLLRPLLHAEPFPNKQSEMPFSRASKSDIAKAEKLQRLRNTSGKIQETNKNFNSINNQLDSLNNKIIEPHKVHPNPRYSKYLNENPVLTNEKDLNLRPFFGEKDLGEKTLNSYMQRGKKFFKGKMLDNYYSNSADLGTLGDWIEGKRAREILKDVLWIPVRKDYSKGMGSLGTYFPDNAGHNMIWVSHSLSPEQLLSTLLHEGYHGLQDLKGKLFKYPMPKLPEPSTNINTAKDIKHIKYLQQPHEIKARQFSRWAEKDVEDFRKTALKVRKIKK